jgi:hypothetical protein
MDPPRSRFIDMSTEASGHNTWRAIVVGLSPLWLIVFALFWSPAFLDPLRTDGVAIAGLPAGVAILGAIGLLTVAGTLVIWRARSRAVLAGAMIVLIFPALWLVILGPTLVLVLTNTVT